MAENGEDAIGSSSSTTTISTTTTASSSTATTTTTSPPAPHHPHIHPSSPSPPVSRRPLGPGENLASDAAEDVKPPASRPPVFPGLCNGYSGDTTALGQRQKVGGKPAHSSDDGEAEARDDLRDSRANPAAWVMVDGAVKEDDQSHSQTQSRAVAVKQEPVSAQDGPLDFSLRRRDSVSESFTDDSRTSSSVSPPGYGAQAYPPSSSASLRRQSPGAEHPLPFPYPHRHSHLAPSHPHPHRHHHGGGSHSHSHSYGSQSGDRDGHLSMSPGSSPDHSELIGQPKTAPSSTKTTRHGRDGGGGGGGGGGGRSHSPHHKGGWGESRSPVNSSLAALGLMAEGGGSGGLGAGGMTPSAMAALLGQQQNGAALKAMGQHPLSSFMGDLRKVQGGNGGKVQRPFKAYPKEVLQMPLGYMGLPGLSPFPGLEPGASPLPGHLPVSQEEVMAMYKQQLELLRERDQQMASISKMAARSSPPSSSSTSAFCTADNNSSNSSRNNGVAHPAPSTSISHSHPPPSHHNPSSPAAAVGAAAASPPSSFFSPTRPSFSSTSTTSSSSSSLHQSTTAPYPSSGSAPFPPPAAHPTLVSSSTGGGSGSGGSCSSGSPSGAGGLGPGSGSGSGSRKRPQLLPDNQKDGAYWERRRKNNDAAKRSRDARRAKEDEIAIRAALLEQENLKLRVEVAALKTETARLRCMLYNNS